MALAAVAALGLSEPPVHEAVDGRPQATMSGADLVLDEVAIEPQQQDALAGVSEIWDVPGSAR